MQGYAPAGEDGAFAQSRVYYAETEEWLASAESAGLQHAELEEELGVRGRELMRRLFQGHLDLLAARELWRPRPAPPAAVLEDGQQSGWQAKNRRLTCWRAPSPPTR